ncbi:hypothetical protein AaE_006485, partial [Aphanomyces astaci]
PPSFKGSTESERRAFMREYQRYTLQVMVLQSMGQRPFLMPVGSCMDLFSNRRIAMFDFGKSHGDVTEDEWMAWFMEAHDEAPDELDALEKRLQVAVQFDTKILDADSRVSRMLDTDENPRGGRPRVGVPSGRELDGGNHLDENPRGGRPRVAIKPALLQLAVTKQLQLQRNKVLKSDVFRYVNWLRQFVIGYQLYGGMDDENLRSRWKTRGLVHVSVRSVKKSGSDASVAPPAWRADKSDEPSERPKPKCLKCQSTAHRVLDHPGITDTEVKKLIDDFHQARRRLVNFVSSTKPANSMECQASIKDVLTLPKVLLAAGRVYRNNHATWAAAPQIVAKKTPREYRMTIDCRPINAWTISMPWSMPNLDAVIGDVGRHEVFFTLDWLKGYWQLPLHPSCQKWYSFMTPFDVYTPTRILMGQTNAVAYSQSVVNQMFGELLYAGLYAGVLGWLDDLLGYADSADKLFALLGKVLAIQWCQPAKLGSRNDVGQLQNTQKSQTLASIRL